MNIEIDGVGYTLHVEKAKQSGALVKSVPHRVGNHYKIHHGQEKPSYYVCAAVDSEGRLALININLGTRYNNPTKVRDMHEITNEEWDKITGGNGHIFVFYEV